MKQTYVFLKNLPTGLTSRQIRSDTNLCLGRTLPSIYQKSVEMQKMFERIDQLEVRISRLDELAANFPASATGW